MTNIFFNSKLYYSFLIFMEISAKAVMELRNISGVSMMACKKALVETGGDQELAIKFLREQGIAKASKKSDRIASEGVIAITNSSFAILNCETDFVARNENFISLASEISKKSENEGSIEAEKYFESIKADKISQLGENIVLKSVEKIEQDGVFGNYIHSNNKVAAIVVLKNGNPELAKDIAMHIVASSPLVISPEEIDDELVKKEKEIWKTQLLESGKPEKLLENILNNKEKKFREESALLKQPFVKDDSKKVEDLLKKENAEIIFFKKIEV